MCSILGSIFLLVNYSLKGKIVALLEILLVLFTLKSHYN